MYRLLIVDDEEIITEALYEVFSQFMSDELDIYKAFSAKEALNWLSRTRIDIVLTDIRMPGMSGLELMNEIQMYWPRCRIIFLTGYSEFEFAYQAIQMPKVKYLLKTEGYAKVTQTVQDVINEINVDKQMSQLLKQSQEQIDTLRFMEQGDYFRHLLQKHQTIVENPAVITNEFERLGINLNSKMPVVLALGHLSYSSEAAYMEKSELYTLTRIIWNSFISDQCSSAAIVDKQGDLLWFLQPSQHAEEKFSSHLIRYLEGTLELVQEACQNSLGITISFTISGAACEWGDVSSQYERLRQLQLMKIGDGASLIQIDRSDQLNNTKLKEDFRIGSKLDILNAHLDAGRPDEFFECYNEITGSILNERDSVHRSVEAYFSLALMLYSYINRFRLHNQISDIGKLMVLDKHKSMNEGFQYIHFIADQIFNIKSMEERDRATLIIEKICKFIQENLSEDLSLVRLAEIHYFNPSYLSRFFKQESGVKLSEYIDNCRIKKAKKLLHDADLKIREVSLMVGYESAHSFTRFFKKGTGMTPQEFRDALISDN